MSCSERSRPEYCAQKFSKARREDHGMKNGPNALSREVTWGRLWPSLPGEERNSQSMGCFGQSLDNKWWGTGSLGHPPTHTCTHMSARTRTHTHVHRSKRPKTEPQAVITGTPHPLLGEERILRPGGRRQYVCPTGIFQLWPQASWGQASENPLHPSWLLCP